MGPTFVHAEDGSVAAVDWVFNGGVPGLGEWDRDEKIGAFVAGLAGTPVVSSPLVNEGGGIQVDGESNVLVTQTVNWTPAAIRASLAPTSRPSWPARSGRPTWSGCPAE